IVQMLVRDRDRLKHGSPVGTAGPYRAALTDTSPVLRPEPLDSPVDGVYELCVQPGVRSGDRRHLELVAGAEEPVVIERFAPAVAGDAARLAQAQPRRGQVVGRVVQHLAASYPLERITDRRKLVDQARANLDHGIELA